VLNINYDSIIVREKLLININNFILFFKLRIGKRIIN